MSRPLYFGRHARRNTAAVDGLRSQLEEQVQAAGIRQIAEREYGYARNDNAWTQRSIIFGDNVIHYAGGHADDPPALYLLAKFVSIQQYLVHPDTSNRIEQWLTARIMAAPVVGAMTLDVEASRVFTSYDNPGQETTTSMNEQIHFMERIGSQADLETTLEHMGAIVLDGTLSQFDAWQSIVPKTMGYTAKHVLSPHAY
jgi:hypothetical protein